MKGITLNANRHRASQLANAAASHKDGLDAIPEGIAALVYALLYVGDQLGQRPAPAASETDKKPGQVRAFPADRRADRR